MKDGMYRVHFSTPHGIVGGGLVKVANGAIFGADGGFMYSGATETDGDKLRGLISVQQHSQGQRSVFENASTQYEIECSGESTEDSFHLRGNVVGDQTARIGIVGWLQATER